MAEDDRSDLAYSDGEGDNIDDYPTPSQDDDDEEDSDDPQEEDSETIALFGADGPTGHHFLRLALDAGYRIRALVPPGKQLAGEFEDLLTVVGTLEDAAQIQQVVYSSTYVVCMLGETTAVKTPDGFQRFVKTLYRIMKRQDDPVVKRFLFQATSLASDGRGKTPVLSKLIRKVVSSKQRSANLQDMDAAIQFICAQHRAHSQEKVSFQYIVTRPSFVLRDGPSTKKLAASKSVSTRS